jgi:hypothetical protein
MMEESIRNTIEVKCAPDAMYDYVTQPWLWHEWHPNSKSAKANTDVLKKGDVFDEVIELQPFSPLPINMKRKTHYKVVVAERSSHWCVEGEMKGGWLRINYEFKPSPTGVIFTRTLSYEVSGINTLIFPLLKPRMRKMSSVALNNLREKLESTKSKSG